MRLRLSSKNPKTISRGEKFFKHSANQYIVIFAWKTAYTLIVFILQKQAFKLS